MSMLAVIEPIIVPPFDALVAAGVNLCISQRTFHSLGRYDGVQEEKHTFSAVSAFAVIH